MATASRKKVPQAALDWTGTPPLKAPPRKRVTKEAAEAPAKKAPAKKAVTKKAVTKRVLTGDAALKAKAVKDAAAAAAAVAAAPEPAAPVQKLPVPEYVTMVKPVYQSWPACCSGGIVSSFFAFYGRQAEPFAKVFAEFKAYMDTLLLTRSGYMLVAAINFKSQRDAYFLMREYGFREAARCITSAHGSEMVIMVKESDKPLPLEGK